MSGGDRAEWFLLDTGHIGLDSGRLRPELIRQLSEAGKMRPVAASQVETGGGRMEIRQGFLDCLRIGGFEHKGLLVSNTQDCNAVGLGFCARYRITLDFPTGVVYLQASRHAIEDQPGGSGLGILRARRQNGHRGRARQQSGGQGRHLQGRRAALG